jgi:hypothetical protein
MHGLMFAELKKYVDQKVGGEAWNTLLDTAGLGGRIYMPVQEYPDADIVALVGAASQATGRTVQAILEDFGEYIVPDLLKMYGSLLERGWKTLDVIEHTEETIHRVVRSRNPGARPPELSCTRPGPDEVVISYRSARKMCSVAKGISNGIAAHFGESIAVTQSVCMLRGDPECLISVRLRR